MGRRRTYGIAGAILLLSGDDSTTALSSVKGRLAADNGLARTGATARDVLANLDSVGIPSSRHLDGICLVVGWVRLRWKMVVLVEVEIGVVISVKSVRERRKRIADDGGVAVASEKYKVKLPGGEAE